MQISTNTICLCKGCHCNDVCEFYAGAIKPVIDITEAGFYDINDSVTIAFINKLVETLGDFDCEYYE